MEFVDGLSTINGICMVVIGMRRGWPLLRILDLTPSSTLQEKGKDRKEKFAASSFKDLLNMDEALHEIAKN